MPSISERLRLDFGPVADRASDRSAGGAAVEHLAGADRRRPSPASRTIRAGTPDATHARYRSGSGRRTRSWCSPAAARRHHGRRARQRHELQVRGFVRSSPVPATPSGPSVIQRIVGLQRHVHGAVAALGDEIEAMVEELAEERHPGIEAGRQADVGRLVGDGLEIGVGGLADRPSGSARSVGATGFMPGWSSSNCASDSGLFKIGFNRRRVVDRHVDDQVGNDARVGIDDIAGQAVVGVRMMGAPDHWSRPSGIESPSPSFRYTGSVSRGNTVSAAPNLLWPGTRLLKLPSTVRRPNGAIAASAAVRPYASMIA